MMVTTSYTIDNLTRKVDLYVMGTPTLSSGDLLTAPLTFQSETGGRVTGGIAKLLQRVAITLLSSNILYENSWGTKLSTYVLGGGTRKDIVRMVYRGVEYVGNLLSEPLTDTKPFDEQLAKLEATSVQYDRDKLSVTLNVVSYGGTSVSLVLPLQREPSQ